jgi:hypothetical protein
MLVRLTITAGDGWQAKTPSYPSTSYPSTSYPSTSYPSTGSSVTPLAADTSTDATPQALQWEVDEWTVFAIAACLSTDPTSLAELALALKRYQPDRDLLAEGRPATLDEAAGEAAHRDNDSGPGDGQLPSGEAPQPWCVIDLRGRTLVAGPGVQLPDKNGVYAPSPGEEVTGFPMLWLDTASRWLFFSCPDESPDAGQPSTQADPDQENSGRARPEAGACAQGDWLERVRCRAAAAALERPLDVRAVLYGRPLAEFLMRRAMAFTGCHGEAAAWSSSERDKRTRQIHAEWLLTPRADLSHRTPREIVVGERERIQSDLEHRADQWQRQGFPPPALSPTSAAYRYGWFGTSEAVIYFRLVRELIAWSFTEASKLAHEGGQADGRDDLLADIPLDGARGDVSRLHHSLEDLARGDLSRQGLERTRSGRLKKGRRRSKSTRRKSRHRGTAAPSELPPLQGPRLEVTLAALLDHRDRWLDNRSRYNDARQTPAELIELERTRMPLVEEFTPLDCECPLCAAMAAEGALTASWCDTSELEMEDDFAFSLALTRQEWELDRGLWNSWSDGDEEVDDDYGGHDIDSYPSYENVEMIARVVPGADAEAGAKKGPGGGNRGGDRPGDRAGEYAGDSDDARLWRTSYVNWQSVAEPGTPSTFVRMAIGFHLAELVGELQELPEGRVHVARLNRAFVEFQSTNDPLVIRSSAQELGSALEVSAQCFPELVSQSADLQSRIDEVLRLIGRAEAG